MSDDNSGIQGHRVRKGKGSEPIRREALQDPDLSFKATGVLAYLLSLPDNWRTDAERLSRAKNAAGKAKEGREAIQAGLRELEEAGYLVRRKYQDDRGRWRWDWRYSEDPSDLQREDVSAGHTGNGLPGDGSTGDGSPVPLEVLEVEVLEVDKKQPSVNADASTLDVLPPGVKAGAGGKPARDQKREDVEELCTLLAGLIVKNGCARPPVINKSWRDAARLLLDRDKIPIREARYVIEWCQRDEFWRTNVLSMPTFRKQYDRLVMRAKQEWTQARRQQNGGAQSEQRRGQHGEQVLVNGRWVLDRSALPASDWRRFSEQ
jgi:hypothetical protein